MRSAHSLCSTLLASLLLGGCIQMPPQPDDPRYAPTLPTPAQIPAATEGAIYRANYGVDLFADRRAARVGDVLEVVLTERTTSKKNADTSITKESTIDIDEGTILGNDVSLDSRLPLDKLGLSSKQLSLLTNLKGNRDFSGEAETEQNNSLQGSVTVSVASVLPNGLLEIRGEKWLTLNRGEELVRIRGYVRQEDITPENTVLSTKVADARITYAGKGELAEANEMGWLSKFFNSSWFPF